MRSIKLLLFRAPSELSVRLVYSVLAFKARYGFGCTVNQLHNWTGLAAPSIKAALDRCDDLVTRQGSVWFANEPPAGWLVERGNAKADEHWFDRAAYLPVEVIEGLTALRCCIYAFLQSKCRERKTQLLTGITVAGLAALFEVERETVEKALTALDDLGYITRHEPGTIAVETKTPEEREERRRTLEIERLCAKPAGCPPAPTSDTEARNPASSDAHSSIDSQVSQLINEVANERANEM